MIKWNPLERGHFKRLTPEDNHHHMSDLQLWAWNTTNYNNEMLFLSLLNWRGLKAWIIPVREQLTRALRSGNWYKIHDSNLISKLCQESTKSLCTAAPKRVRIWKCVPQGQSWVCLEVCTWRFPSDNEISHLKNFSSILNNTVLIKWTICNVHSTGWWCRNWKLCVWSHSECSPRIGLSSGLGPTCPGGLSPGESSSSGELLSEGASDPVP